MGPTESILIEDMTWPEVEEAMDEGKRTIVFSVSSIEQHGPHLPLKMDTLAGDELSRRVAVELGDALVAPTVHTGCSSHHMDFPGTITVPTDLFMQLVTAHCRSFDHHGFEHIVIIATHGGNFAPLNAVVPDIARELDADIIPLADLNELMSLMNEGMQAAGVDYEEPVIHAGAAETAIVMAVAPELVREEELRAGFEGEVPVTRLLSEGFRSITDEGVLGDPREATADAGKAILEKLTEAMVARVEAER